MLQNQDYILRLIEMVGVMVRRAMELVRGERPAEALDLLDEAVRSMVSTDPALLERLTPDGLVTFLGAGAAVEPLTANALAETLEAKSEALAMLGREGGAEHARAQADALRSAVRENGA